MAPISRPTIGLLTPSTTSPWAARQWEGFARCARELDVNLIGYIGGVIRSSRYDEQANVLYGLAAGGKLDGLAIWSTAIGWNISKREMGDFQGMGSVVSHLIEAHGRRRPRKARDSLRSPPGPAPEPRLGRGRHDEDPAGRGRPRIRRGGSRERDDDARGPPLAQGARVSRP